MASLCSREFPGLHSVFSRLEFEGNAQACQDRLALAQRRLEAPTRECRRSTPAEFRVDCVDDAWQVHASCLVEDELDHDGLVQALSGECARIRGGDAITGCRHMVEFGQNVGASVGFAGFVEQALIDVRQGGVAVVAGEGLLLDEHCSSGLAVAPGGKKSPGFEHGCGGEPELWVAGFENARLRHPAVLADDEGDLGRAFHA